MALNVRCIGCGGLVPDIAGPTHRYMESSPGCWQVFGEVLAREYGDPYFGAVHRLTADTYAVQHPGRPSSRQAIQSVNAHLLSLCLILERGMPPGNATRALKAAVDQKSRFDWLTPPESLGAITVVDVLAATTPEEHGHKVRAWAGSAWSAWAPHHDTIRAWASRLWGPPPSTAGARQARAR